MNEETRNKALELTCKLERDTIQAHETMDKALTGLREAIDQIIKKLEPIDPKDPEELERFKNAPDGYPDSFKSEYEQQTSDNRTGYPYK